MKETRATARPPFSEPGALSPCDEQAPGDVTFSVRAHATPTAPAERARQLVAPGFGRVFTDHMVTIRYTADRGWHDAEVRPREPLSLDPATAVLHYAQEIFEGLKAYRLDDGGVALFRPVANAARFRASAERLAMMPLPEGLFGRSLRELVRIDADWVPGGAGGSLYLRPFMFASEPFLGVRPSREYMYVVIASPVEGYFKGGMAPISVWVPDRMVRAAPGGTGFAKCGGNYAASLLPQAEALAHGCDQVLFLDAVAHRWIEELGGMNLFFVMRDGSIVTPPLGDTILAGITRQSIITLLRDRNLIVREELYAIEQLRDDVASGALTEAFACGTAAVVAPIGNLRGSDWNLLICDGWAGALTTEVRTALIGIQRGTQPDPHGWVERVL